MTDSPATIRFPRRGRPVSTVAPMPPGPATLAIPEPPEHPHIVIGGQKWDVEAELRDRDGDVIAAPIGTHIQIRFSRRGAETETTVPAPPRRGA